MQGLTTNEILKIVNRYIGVNNGYLGDFSYRTHKEFYPEYCNLDINTDDFEGTTRDRFICILRSREPFDQAKIIQGILKRFPIGKNAPSTRTKELRDEILNTAKRLEGLAHIDNSNLKIASDVVHKAISDAKALIQTNGPISAIDRIHTALHGYLIAVCDKAQIAHDQDANASSLIRALQDQHPALNRAQVRSGEIKKILNSLRSIIDALGTIRNRASLAHPNDELLGKDEAMLVINVTDTIMHYLDEKFADSYLA